ncbi:MAG: alpha/beta hydrolase-fold protein [Myxococcales bacterium]
MRVFAPQGEPRGVAYCWDGQNLFGDGEELAGWHMDEILEERAAQGRFAPVVVAIDHGGRQRIGDYAPWPHSRFRRAGRAGALLDWVVGELKPFVDRELGPTPREATLVCGSSMGGLLSLYAWLRHPDVFGRAIAMSPSLWYSPQALFDTIASFQPAPADSRVWMDIGKRESSKWARQLLASVGSALVARGLPEDRLAQVVDPNGRHHESSWSKRLPDALDFVGQD